MAEASIQNVKPSDVNTKEQNLIPDLEVRSDTSEDSSTTENYRYLHYGYRSSNCSDDDDDDDDDEGDPYQELFMNAYRSVPASSDEDDHDDRGKCTNNNNYPPEAKPLSLMEDWELWDSMDENELKEQLKDHPKLLEQITRNRKRKLLDEDEEAGENENLSEMMDRFVKYIRRDPTNVTS